MDRENCPLAVSCLFIRPCQTCLINWNPLSASALPSVVERGVQNLQWNNEKSLNAMKNSCLVKRNWALVASQSASFSSTLETIWPAIDWTPSYWLNSELLTEQPSSNWPTNHQLAAAWHLSLSSWEGRLTSPWYSEMYHLAEAIFLLA